MIAARFDAEHGLEAAVLGQDEVGTGAGVVVEGEQVVRERFGVAGLQIERPAIAVDRGVDLAVGEHRTGKVGERPDMERHDRERLAEARGGIGGAAEPLQREASVVVEIRDRGRVADCLIEHRQTIRWTLGLQCRQPEQVQRVGMARCERQDAAIDRLSFGQARGSMQLERVIEQHGHRGRRRRPAGSGARLAAAAGAARRAESGRPAGHRPRRAGHSRRGTAAADLKTAIAPARGPRCACRG